MKPRSNSFKKKSGGKSHRPGSSRGASPRQTGKIQGREPFPPSKRIVIGQHALIEAFKSNPQSAVELWVRQGWNSSQDLRYLVEEMKPAKVPVVEKHESSLEKVGWSHQGACLFMKDAPQFDWSNLDDEHGEQGLVIALDGIEDPQNLGAILRTAWLMGAELVLGAQDRAVGLTPSVHKVACGGVEHVPFEEHANFQSPLERLKEKGYWVYGLSHEAKQSVFDLKYPEKVVWCIGSEDKGLRSTTQKLCDELVSIPQLDAAASYNASVATAIALSETVRQRRLGK